jgi:diguanylate cyclase (GGDEF)-like protein
MSQKPTVVLVDYDKKRLERHSHALVAAGIKAVRVTSGSAAIEECRKSRPMAVVSEAMVPEGNGFDVLRALKADPVTAHTRVLMVVDESDSYTMNRAQIAGLDGILVRPFTPEALVARLKGLEAEGARDPGRPGTVPADLTPILNELESRVRAENPLLPHLTDQVTGLWNAAYTTLKIADEFKRARRFALPLACVVLGIDETPGAAPADDVASRQILTEIAGLLLCESRDIDHLSRLDGKSFLVLLPHTDEHGALAMTTRVLSAIEKRQIVPANRTRPISASAGIATFTKDASGPDDLVRWAQDAFARAMSLGGNRVEVAGQDRERMAR